MNKNLIAIPTMTSEEEAAWVRQMGARDHARETLRKLAQRHIAVPVKRVRVK